MLNRIKCAGQYTVDLINNIISRNVQEECANRLYRVYTQQQYVWWRIMIILPIINWSHVDVMRPILSLGACWQKLLLSLSVFAH